MAPIRKGNGTGLAPKGIAEVRKGDGTVLYSAGTAIPDSVVDDFEDGDISEYGGNTSAYSVQQSTVLNGSHALQGSGNDIGISSTSGLSEYPQQGNRTRAYMYLGNAEMEISFAYFVQSEGRRTNGYYVMLSPPDGELQFDKDMSLTSPNKVVSASISTNTWYYIEILPKSTDVHEVTLYDTNDNKIASLSYDDSGNNPYTSGGIGFYQNEVGSAADCFYDYVVTQ